MDLALDRFSVSLHFFEAPCVPVVRKARRSHLICFMILGLHATPSSKFHSSVHPRKVLESLIIFFAIELHASIKYPLLTSKVCSAAPQSNASNEVPIYLPMNNSKRFYTPPNFRDSSQTTGSKVTLEIRNHIPNNAHGAHQQQDKHHRLIRQKYNQA